MLRNRVTHSEPRCLALPARRLRLHSSLGRTEFDREEVRVCLSLNSVLFRFQVKELLAGNKRADAYA